MFSKNLKIHRYSYSLEFNIHFTLIYNMKLPLMDMDRVRLNLGLSHLLCFMFQHFSRDTTQWVFSQVLWQENIKCIDWCYILLKLQELWSKNWNVLIRVKNHGTHEESHVTQWKPATCAYCLLYYLHHWHYFLPCDWLHFLPYIKMW